jgi:hypothetical protein
MLTGFAAGEATIGRTIIEEVADTFDMLPRGDRGRQSGEEREAPARIFTAAGRAELWAAGTGGGAHNAQGESVSPLAMREEAGSAATTTTGGSPEVDEVGSAFRRSGLMGER